MRTFISIDIPEEIKREIQKIQECLPKFIGKKVETENLHLTLKFLGEIDEQKIGEVKIRLGGINFNKFESEINEVGVFSEKFVRIVWLHLSGCEKLQKKIDESLADLFEPEQRFMSHLTIARIKSLEDKKYFLSELSKIKIPSIKFVVDRFKLKESVLKSEGPVYGTMDEYPLV